MSCTKDNIELLLDAVFRRAMEDYILARTKQLYSRTKRGYLMEQYAETVNECRDFLGDELCEKADKYIRQNRSN